MKKTLLGAIYSLPIFAVFAVIFGSEAVSHFAFKRASGQEFHFLGLDSHAEVTLSHSYIKPYIKFHIDYDVAPFSKGYQDLFQTADINSGLRMEFSQNTSGIVFGTATPPGGFGFQIHNLVRCDHRQQITVRALDNGYVWTDDSEMGRNIVRVPTPHILINHVIIGQGFDPSRGFTGHIFEADFSVCEYALYRDWMILGYLVLGLLFLGTLGVIFVSFWRARAVGR